MANEISELSAEKPIIQLADLSFKYPGSDSLVINGLDLNYHRGDRIGIMAPNGSGKTTLFYLIMGLFKPAGGEIRIFGKPARTEKDFESVRRKIGLLFQDSDDQLFSPTVMEDVAFGPLNLGKKPKEAMEIARETLDQLGLNGFENRITYKLSGGEKRLVALATVLAMKPEVLLLDEPSTALDEKTKKRLIDYLTRLDLSYLIISHDHDFMFQLAQTNFTMENGKLHPIGRMHRHYHIHPHGSHSH